MKVALVSPYDAARPGGVNSHVTQLARQLRALGHEARVIAPVSRLCAGEADLIPAPGAIVPMHINGATAHVGLSPAAFRWLHAVLDREGFDVIHAHEPLLPVLPLAALLYHGAAKVGTFHAHYAGTRLHALARPLLHPFFKRLDVRIAVSAAALRSAAGQFPGHYRIIPLAVDVAAFRWAAPLPEYADGKVNVLFVGRLDPRKGIDHLLAAFALAQGQRADARLILVGPLDRPAWQHYRQLASAHGLAPEQTVFAGPVDQAVLPRYYASADVFCSPALGGESFGMVLLEAMASGKPIVATRIGGYRDLVGEWREALLVPPGDVEALAAALSLAVGSQDLRHRLGEQGRRTALDYDWPRIARRIVAAYEEALAGRRAKAAKPR